ncbi:GNAT family N-acetyltransferase [Tsukamurella serpentis]
MESEHEVHLVGSQHARTAARLQVDFNTEFHSPTPSVEVLERRYARLMDDPAAFVLFAGDPARPTGYALVTLRPTVYCEGPLAVLDELYVVPPLRDGGIGTALLLRVLDEIRRRGGGEIHINVDEVDVDTRRFYDRHGFYNIEPGTDYRMLCYIRELE